MNQPIYSFDVFDTALVRVWANPTDLFWQLGYDLKQAQLIEISPELWMKFRIEAEKEARQFSDSGEVTIWQIYQQLAIDLNLTKDIIEKAVQREIELELDSLRAIPTIKNKINKLHSLEQKVIYISDMYLPSKIIEKALIMQEIWQKVDSLYVSSEANCNKASGYLFGYCLEKELIKKSQLNHIGDNLHSDYKIPKKLKIKACHFSEAQLNQYEKKIWEAGNIPLNIRSLTAGASRLTRLQLQEDIPDKKVIWNTAANVIAPVLFGFVHWCLLQAQNQGIKRLYFIARDGQILLKIAEVICKNWNYPIECRYLYGSRQAWHLPAIQEVSDFELNWIFDPTQFLSVRSVCERVNITPEQIKDDLKNNEFAENKWDTNLTNLERDKLKKIFQQSAINDLIINTATSYRQKVLAYFEQEGIFDDISFGLVDIGWHGRLQCSFSKLINLAKKYPKNGVYGFYFALSKRIKAFSTDQLFAYFSDVNQLSERDRLCQYRALFELFVAADHGGTIKYEEQQGKYVPVLRYPKNELAIAWGLPNLQKAIVCFAEELTQNIKLKDNISDFNYLRTLSHILLEKFIYSPSIEEAQVFGDFKVAEDQTECIFYKLAPIYNLKDCWNLFLKDKQIHNNVWFEASKSRSFWLSKLILNQYGKGIKKHLFNQYKLLINIFKS